VTIRAKLYAAIVLTILGPLATIAVALQGMAQLGDRFDEVHERAEQEAIARELKFLVTDVNGWQTAYGYADGEFRGRFVTSSEELRGELELAAEQFTGQRERQLLARLERQFEAFMELDEAAWDALLEGRSDETERILLGPELARFETMAATAEQLADYQAEQASATDAAFDEARDDARRRLVAVALGAGVVILLLLVTANDIARLALEGERNARGRRDANQDDDEATDDEPS
jgi:hypothetical protein